MKKTVYLIFLLLITYTVKGQHLYVKTFGKTTDKALIFLHGGPGYNCANFEGSTAQKLADQGFFVIVYDRRGEGRSADPNAKFNFEQSFDDLNYLYETYKLKNANLVGHSFGGVLATRFAERYPEKISAVFLVSSPVSLQETFKTIIKSSKAIYEKNQETEKLNFIAMIEKMDTASLRYSSFCFLHAVQNGFYSPKEISEETKNIYTRLKSDSIILRYASEMSYQAPQGFWNTEKYTTIDLTDNLRNLLAKNIPVYGLYGKDDGLYSSEQVMALQEIIGEDQLLYLEKCSHNVFIDQQVLFLEKLKKWGK